MAKQTGAFEVALVGQAVPANGGVMEVANPEGVTLIVKQATLYVDTPSAGAANLAVGTGAAGAANNSIIAAQAINGAITGLAYNLLAPAAGAAEVMWTAAQVILNVALAANPIGLVVLAIAALVLGLVLAWRKSETFRNIVTGAFGAVKDKAVDVFSWIKANWPCICSPRCGPRMAS